MGLKILKKWEHNMARGIIRKNRCTGGNPGNGNKAITVFHEDGDKEMNRGFQRVFRDRFPDLRTCQEKIVVLEKATRAMS